MCSNHWYANTHHAALSRRDPKKGTLENWSRWELQQYLESEGFAVYDSEDTEDLRLAVKLHAEMES